MKSRSAQARRRPQAGFSMVEMLMAALILAIGILGLAMLQTMSLKAGRGSGTLTSAIKIADRTLDQIEMEGRLSWLNITNTEAGTPTALTTLKFIAGKAQTLYVPYLETTDATGLTRIDPAASSPVKSKPDWTPTTRFIVTITEGAATSVTTGKTSDFQVLVEFADEVTKTGTRVIRTVTVTRSIVHG